MTQTTHSCAIEQTEAVASTHVAHPKLTGCYQGYVIVERGTRETLREIDEFLAACEDPALARDQPLDLVLTHALVEAHDAAGTNEDTGAVVRELLVGGVVSDPRQRLRIPIGRLGGDRFAVADRKPVDASLGVLLEYFLHHHPSFRSGYDLAGKTKPTRILLIYRNMSKGACKKEHPATK